MWKQSKYYLNYAWRVLATGVGFSLFGIGAMCLSYILIPILKLGVRNQQQKYHRAQHAISISFKIFISYMQLTRLATFEFRGFDKLQQDRGSVIVSNHPTLIDYVMIVSRLKNCDIIVKRALWDNWFLSGVVKTAGYIPNIETEVTFDAIAAKIAQGNNVLIFPEGTRTKPGLPIKLQRGAAQIALRTRSPIRMVNISCQPTMLAKQNRWYRIPKTKSRFVLEVMELIDSTAFLPDTTLPLAARELTAYLQRRWSEIGSDARSRTGN